ncbi:hypothetical protein DFH09DRAFT_1336118 [Mycena vulgaris]|nr:hypothetical protein DFH09DRAFT_1336118 [Mycena vulgaris]
MRRAVDLAPPSRVAQRKQRLLELENEQRIEDAEALKMAEERGDPSGNLIEAVTELGDRLNCRFGQVTHLGDCAEVPGT